MLSAREAVIQLKNFAAVKIIPDKDGPMTFKEYLTKVEKHRTVDEETVIQPVAFPAFANHLLGWDLNVNLSAEISGKEGKPDFTPADAVSHPFVFETKGTHKGAELRGDEAQVLRYLTDGAPRIQKVVLTNLHVARVFTLDESKDLKELYSVDFKSLIVGPVDTVSKLPNAQRLATFVQDFSRQELTPDEKVERVRSAPPWNPVVATTTSEWMLERLDRIVSTLSSKVRSRIRSGALDDVSSILPSERTEILSELRALAERLGENGTEVLTISDFVTARQDSLRDKALMQYSGHTAFYAATRLMLIRVWEDFGLIETMLYDGGFDKQMKRFDNIIEVVQYSFRQAKKKYRPLFDLENKYSWFEPDEESYKEVIYELANTYLGNIESDILGRVYERLLERIDRKLLGIYYTPRDIISLIWDLIDLDAVAIESEAQGRQPRILDIATGSGGFLVEAALRLRQRHSDQLDAGANIKTQSWLNEAVDGLNGIEYQQFAAYLAELNMLVQLGQVMRKAENAKIPPIGIIRGDSLSFHEPDTAFTTPLDGPGASLIPSAERVDRAERLRAVRDHDFQMDVACGNPPYIGEKSAAPILRATRTHYPYWEKFVGPHMDYLYWFLILGVSKLRPGGRFGFITSEYWLRAAGAKPLREYLAKNAVVDRIILLRDFRPFPDAPGHHSLIVIGKKLNDVSNAPQPQNHKVPRVSIYLGSNLTDETQRAKVLKTILLGKTAASVQSFEAQRLPNSLGGGSWSEVILTPKQMRARTKLAKTDQLAVSISKGVETTVNALNAESRQLLNAHQADAVTLRQGIQLLTAEEVSGLGPLNETEKGVIRRVVNTKDIYPYACVLPETGTSHIYLAKTVKPNSDLSDDAVVRTEFPPGMPRIQAYLEQFRPVLEYKTNDRKERRPWWTLHRPRYDVVGDEKNVQTSWSDYAVTTRWGGGGQLVVGLAPASVSPASGLHIMRPSSNDVSAAYLAGLYNSEIYQEVAKSLPPGQLRQNDLGQLGLPDIGANVGEVAKRALSLANLVTTMVSETARMFPTLPGQLREDVTLATVPNDIWTPQQSIPGEWGEIENVHWIRSVETTRSARTPLGKCRVTHDLFGLTVQIEAKNSESIAATVHVDSTDEAVADALVALLRGMTRGPLVVGDLQRVLVPTTPERLLELLKSDTEELERKWHKYRTLRSEIELIITNN